MLALLDTVIQGVLLGGLYALFALGLSLIFGIMRLVNLAHGDLIVLAAFVIFALAKALGLNSFGALVLAAPILFAFGYALQHFVLNRTLGRDILPPLLVTFGLSIIIQNGLLEAFSADTKRLSAGRAGNRVGRSPAGIGGRRHAAPDACFRNRRDLRAQLSCSTARRSDAPSAPPRTIRRSPSSWVSTIARSLRSPWRSPWS